MLSRLSSAGGNFLGDTALVENLEITKRTAAEIEQKVNNTLTPHHRKLSLLMLKHNYDKHIGKKCYLIGSISYREWDFPPQAQVSPLRLC